MSKPREITIDQDLFLPQIATLPLRDQRDTMERPFFSLHKRKRTKPIDYVSPDGKVSVHVTGNPEYGIATIYDLDVLIYCASMVEYKRRGVNDIPQTLAVVPYDMLKVLRRDTGGGEYQNLANALARLQSTTVRTNLHSVGRRETTFSWLDSFTQVIDAKGRIRGMRITLAKWFYDSVLMDGGVLAIDPDYFDISGGLSRWLYRVARKHAGGNGAQGFTISMPTLYEKSGSESPYRRFKFEIQKLARENVLPGYGLEVIPHEGREPSLRMTRRAQPVPAEEAAPAPFPAPAPSGRRKPAASPPRRAHLHRAGSGGLPRFRPYRLHRLRGTRAGQPAAPPARSGPCRGRLPALPRQAPDPGRCAQHRTDLRHLLRPPDRRELRKQHTRRS
jgi:plasmid replication initiation protein